MVQKLNFLSKAYWFSVATLFERIIPLILLPVILNDIGVSNYGVLYLILTVINFFLPILSFGFNFFFSKEYSLKNDAIFKSIFSNFLIVQSIFLIFISIIIFSLTSTNLIDINYFDSIVLIILVLSQVVNLSIKEIFRIRQKIKPFIIIVFFIFFIDVSLTLIFLKTLNIGYKSRIYASCCAFFLTSFFSIFYLRDFIQLKINKFYLLKWFLFGKKIIVYKISGFLLNKGDRFIIKILLGEFSLGLYIVAIQVASPFLILMNTINSGWNSFIYNFLKQNKFIYSDLRKYFKFIFIFLLIIFLIYQNLLQYLFIYLTQDISLDEIYYIQFFICLAYIAQIMYSIHLPVFISSGRQNFISKIGFFSAIFNIILNIILLILTKDITYSAVLFFINWLINYCLLLNKNIKVIK